MGTIVVGAILVVIVGAIIWKLAKDRKAGKHTCGGDCGSCGGHCH